MLPVVIGSTEQMLQLVPDHLREAATRSAPRKSRAITIAVVLPAALPGIVCGLPARDRARGRRDRAAAVRGRRRHRLNPHLFNEANTALSIQIFGNATSSFVAAQDRAWGAALTLVVMSSCLTIVAARWSHAH